MVAGQVLKKLCMFSWPEITSDIEYITARNLWHDSCRSRYCSPQTTPKNSEDKTLVFHYNTPPQSSTKHKPVIIFYSYPNGFFFSGVFKRKKKLTRLPSTHTCAHTFSHTSDVICVDSGRMKPFKTLQDHTTKLLNFSFSHLCMYIHLLPHLMVNNER